MEASSSSSNAADVTEMFQKIVDSPDAFFRHQLRSEPDLETREKQRILAETFTKKPVLFLSRYHKFLSAEDLPNFCALDPKTDFEARFYLSEIAKNQQVSSKTAKNRRYSALQKLMGGEDFFSDWEMRAREPLLYDQMIGQFQTSEESRESLHSDGGGHAGIAFSSILLDFCQTKSISEEKDRQQRAEDEDGNFDGNFSAEKPANLNIVTEEQRTVKQLRAMKLEKMKRKISEMEDSSEEEEMDDEESEEDEAPRRQVPEISPEEKNRLRQEFVSLMHERFLSGADADYFDYKSVDQNPEYDAMDLINMDEQDKYFDSEEPS